MSTVSIGVWVLGALGLSRARLHVLGSLGYASVRF